MKEPRDLAGSEFAIPGGSGDRFSGYAVIGLPFSSGHVLALRRIEASSFGPAYTSVWHRDPEGCWTFHQNVPPEQSCPRYFGAAISETTTEPIRIDWTDPRRVCVTVDAPGGIVWDVRLASTPATRMRRLTACLAALAVPAFAQEPLTLQQAVDLALQKHPAIEAAAQQVKAAEARIGQARSGYLPKVNYQEMAARSNNPVFVFSSLLTQHQFTEQNFAIATLNRPGFLDNFQSLVSVEQTVWDNHATKNQVKMAETGRALTAEDERRERLNMTTRVVQSYFGATLAQAALDTARESVRSAEADLKRAESVRNAGMSTDADVLSIRVHLAAVREQEVRRATDLEVARGDAQRSARAAARDGAHALDGASTWRRCPVRREGVRIASPATAAGDPAGPAGRRSGGPPAVGRQVHLVAHGRRAGGIRSRPPGLLRQGRRQLVVRCDAALEPVQRLRRQGARRRVFVRRWPRRARRSGRSTRACASKCRRAWANFNAANERIRLTHRDGGTSRREPADHQESLRGGHVHGDGPVAHRDRAARGAHAEAERDLRSTARCDQRGTGRGNPVAGVGGAAVRSEESRIEKRESRAPPGGRLCLAIDSFDRRLREGAAGEDRGGGDAAGGGEDDWRPRPLSGRPSTRLSARFARERRCSWRAASWGTSAR